MQAPPAGQLPHALGNQCISLANCPTLHPYSAPATVAGRPAAMCLGF